MGDASTTPAASRGRLNPLQVVDRLQAENVLEETNLDESQRLYADYVEEEVHDDEGPVLRDFEDELGESVYHSMTNFTKAEFEILWETLRPDVLFAWQRSKGRKHKTSAKDAFFMTICVIKHCNAWYKHAADFRLQPSAFERMVDKMLGVIEPILTSLYIVKPSGMGYRKFDNFPYALYATDVKFQQSNRPGGTFQDAKKYFSGKHHLYGLKVECSVSADGRCVDVTKHYAGSVTDASIFIENLDTHLQMLKKTDADRVLPSSDFQEGASRFPDHWAVLVDKGYQGMGVHVRTIQPKKQPPHGSLSADDIDRNRLVSHDRVIVENFFGRVNMLWRVMYKTYTWKEERYDQLVRVCFALTNFHIGLNPLRAQDRENYRATLAKYASQAHHRAERRRRQHADSLARRRERMEEGVSVSARRAGSQNSPYAARGSFRDSPYAPSVSRSSSHRAGQTSPTALLFEESQGY